MKRMILLIGGVVFFAATSSFAQTVIIIEDGTLIYVPFESEICADSIIVNEGGSYITADSSGTCPEASISGGGFIQLPVELISFAASVNNYRINLKWDTGTELNNYGFEIERQVGSRSASGGAAGNWEIVGFVEGHENSTSPKQYSFTDKNPVGGSIFQYRLKQIDMDGTFEYSDVVEVELIPNEFVLHQNYPNPFNPATTIKYALPIESKVRIVLYNSLGEFVAELVDEIQSAGYQEAVWNAGGVASGVYIFRIEAVPTNGAEIFTSIKKMVLLK